MITEMPFGFNGKIFRSPMPFSQYDIGLDVWLDYVKNRINVVVVLVEEVEFFDKAVRDLLKFYKDGGVEFIHYPISDFQTPLNKNALIGVIEEVISRAKNGDNIAVHCLAGIGRTGLFMACMAKRYFQINGQDAIGWVRNSIPGAVENSIQESYILNF